jgi:hypothetical protein
MIGFSKNDELIPVHCDKEIFSLLKYFHLLEIYFSGGKSTMT